MASVTTTSIFTKSSLEQDFPCAEGNEELMPAD